jgi:hypothetical protein
MATEEMRVEMKRAGARSGTRLLGTIGVICGPALLIAGIYRKLTGMADSQDDKVVALLSVVYIGGWMASVVGMRRLRVTGRSRWSTAIFFVQLFGLTMAGLWALALLVGLDAQQGSIIFSVTDPFWPLSHLFMLLVGGLVLKAGVWRGWRRLPPFLCGTALLLVFVAQPLGLKDAGVFLFLLMTAIGFSALGYAVRSSSSS